MLRIQRSTKRGVVRLALSGRIDGEQLLELQRLIESEDWPGGLTLGLEEVKLVDEDGVRFLARCEASGARIEGCAPYVREWITREGPTRKQRKARIDRR